MKTKRAAIGIKTRTGRAVAVALSRPSEFICREEMTLCDESTQQPYHNVMELPWTDSLIAVKPAIAAIEKIAAAELRRLIDNVESRGYEVAAIAVVGPADRKLERIGNPHIRAHAAEVCCSARWSKPLRKRTAWLRCCLSNLRKSSAPDRRR